MGGRGGKGRRGSRRAEGREVGEVGGEGGGREGAGGRGAAGKGGGGAAEKPSKMKGTQKSVIPNFRAAGRRIRWRVPELTPKTPRGACGLGGLAGIFAFTIPPQANPYFTK